MTEGPYKLPEGWRWVRLGEVCIINPRRPRIQREPNTPTTFIPMSAIDDESGTIVAAEERPFEQVRKGYTYFEENDILFAKITPCMENGKAAIARGLLDGIGFGSTEFHVLRPNSSVVPEWIWLFVRREQFREDAKRSFRGGVGQQRVPQEFLEWYLIPLPPLEEQRRIVARVEELMSRIREAKRLRQEAKEEAERLWQSILSETFPKPGSELPKGWRWVRLGDVCEYRTGIWGPEASDPTQGFPIIRSTEIEGLLIRPQTASVRMVRRGQVDAYKLETGDILINKSSGSPHLVGWPAIFEDPRDGKIYLFSNFMLRLRADRRTLEPWFLLYYLHSPTARSIYLGAQDTTSGLRNLRVREFMVQPIPLPPLEEQRRIVAYFQDVQGKIRALKEVQAQTEAELKRLEQAILDKAFRGEL
jgi:type I restriction enzyme S subunit